MAGFLPSLSLKSVLFVWVFSLSLVVSPWESSAIEGRKLGESNQNEHFHTLDLNSLLPSDSCSPSSPALGKQSTLKVVHKHGPCSNLHKDKSSAPTPTDILLEDQSRVKSIHDRISKSKKTSSSSDVPLTDAATLPAKSGRPLEADNYIVQVGLGTPARELSFIFDTGSDLTWTQCVPCATECYKQKEPIFNPSQSSSYHNVSCNSSACGSLISTTRGNKASCESSTCKYSIKYDDHSYSKGFLGTDTLSLTQSDVFPEFYFGCGENNNGSFDDAAGLIGLGRDKLSLVSQTASKYKKLFSYCLPSSSSSTGFLTFGSGSEAAMFTPLSSAVPSNSYGLDFTGISVSGKMLAIPQSAFTTAGAIIDSGTVITRLPPAAYSALRAAFRQGMSKYPTAPKFSILDTCYDLSAYTSDVSFPTVQMYFKGGVIVNISSTGIMYINKPWSQVCLAFAANKDASHVAILGNVQQRTQEVVYDVANGRVGFASGGCS